MKNALVMGMQTSGMAATALLKREGFEVRGYDDALAIENNWKDRGEEIFRDLELAVISPSIPNVHPVLIGLKERGIPVISELELGSRFVSGTKIAVTGTNGKTTTVDMLQKALSIMGFNAKAMGNIGYPVSQVAVDGTELDYAVIETSSFQLEYVTAFRPKIGILLNVAPDHMDRYDKYEDYVEAKKRLFARQTAEDFAVMNYDSRLIREFGKKLPSDVRYVSAKEQKGEFYIKNNYFYRDERPLVSVRDVRAKGEHNRFNMLAVMNVLSILGAKDEQIVAFVKDYKLLPHRIEFVASVGGKNYYNDSKGTNILACRAAIDTVGGKIGLILGGSDKREEFCEFFDEIYEKVACVAVTGGNAEKIQSSALKVGFNDITVCENLNDALKLLSAREDVENILFSPASASFDRYSGYAERGEFFKTSVYELKA